MKRYRRIETLQKMLDRVKQKFPKAKKKKIEVRYRSLPHELFTVYYEKRRYVIDADSNTAPGMTREEVIGGLAHEIAHHEIDGHLRGLASVLDTKRYESSEVYRKQVEQLADVKAITHGLGSELYRFAVFCKKRGFRQYGLTLREIRKLARLRKP